MKPIQLIAMVTSVIMAIIAAFLLILGLSRYQIPNIYTTGFNFVMCLAITVAYLGYIAYKESVFHRTMVDIFTHPYIIWTFCVILAFMFIMLSIIMKGYGYTSDLIKGATVFWFILPLTVVLSIVAIIKSLPKPED